MKAKLFSTREVAAALGVSESTVRRWCDQKRMDSVRSMGGHRKVTMASIIRFAREAGYSIEHAELLGIASSNRGLAGKKRFAEFVAALSEDDATYCHFVMTSAYVNGESFVEIFDELLGRSMIEIGRLWESGAIGVDQERRACQIVMGGLRQLESYLPKHERIRGLAVGCTPEGDFSEIGSKMAELILKRQGWNACQFGAGIPLVSIAAACERVKPDLLWLSIVHMQDTGEFVQGYKQHIEPLIAKGLTVVVGGRELTDALRASIRYSFYGRSMQQLANYVDGVPLRTRNESTRPLTFPVGEVDPTLASLESQS